MHSVLNRPTGAPDIRTDDLRTALNWRKRVRKADSPDSSMEGKVDTLRTLRRGSITAPAVRRYEESGYRSGYDRRSLDRSGVFQPPPPTMGGAITIETNRIRQHPLQRRLRPLLKGIMVRNRRIP
jgi:hypothetical protein